MAWSSEILERRIQEAGFAVVNEASGEDYTVTIRGPVARGYGSIRYSATRPSRREALEDVERQIRFDKARLHLGWGEFIVVDPAKAQEDSIREEAEMRREMGVAFA